MEHSAAWSSHPRTQSSVRTVGENSPATKKKKKNAYERNIEKPVVTTCERVSWHTFVKK